MKSYMIFFVSVHFFYWALSGIENDDVYLFLVENAFVSVNMAILEKA